MKQIIKRLELIKTAIALEDEEIIELQVMKLEKLGIDAEVQLILAEIETVDYANVVILIEQYIIKYSGVAIYEDKELEALRFELKLLEGKLQEKIELKNEYQNDISEFNTRYSLELGDTIRRGLDLRKQILAKALKVKTDAFEKLKKKLEELDEYDEDYDRVYQEYNKAKDDLTDDPFFDKYNDAKTDYEEFQEEKQLRTKIEELRESLADIEQALEDIKENDIYTLLDELDDVEEYFRDMKVALDSEMERLNEELED